MWASLGCPVLARNDVDEGDRLNRRDALALREGGLLCSPAAVSLTEANRSIVHAGELDAVSDDGLDVHWVIGWRRWLEMGDMRNGSILSYRRDGATAQSHTWTRRLLKIVSSFPDISMVSGSRACTSGHPRPGVLRPYLGLQT